MVHDVVKEKTVKFSFQFLYLMEEMVPSPILNLQFDYL